MSKSQELNLRHFSSEILRKRSSSFIRNSRNLASLIHAKPKFYTRKTKTQNAVDRVAEIFHQTGRADNTDSIREEIYQTIAFALKYRRRLLRSAKKEESSIYLSPKAIEDFLVSRKSKRTYTGCHIQINPSGTMYVIPKKKAFKLGRGTFKYVRLAVELDIDATPKRAVAFARISIKKVEKVYRQTNRLNPGKRLDRNSRKDIYDSLCSEVALIREMIDLRGQDLGFSAEDVSLSVYGTDKNFIKADFVMPFCELGDLDQCFTTLESRWEVIQGCVECVREWHGKGYTHFDIKPENFLATRGVDGLIQIHSFDLAFSHKPSPDPKKRRRQGSIPYCAPELWINDKDFDPFLTDIYALGITLYQIMRQTELSNGFPKYVEIALNSLEKGNFKQELEIVWDLFYARSGFDVLVKAMTNPAPEKRPNIERVRKLMPWVRENDSNPRRVAKRFGIDQGVDPRSYGAELAVKWQAEKHFETQEVCNIMANFLTNLYTAQDMEQLYEGFEKHLLDKSCEKAEMLLTLIDIFIQEKRGTIASRKIAPTDLLCISRGHCFISVTKADELLGNREGAWTFCRDINDDPWIIAIEMGRWKCRPFTLWKESGEAPTYEDLLSFLTQQGFNPLGYVPKLLFSDIALGDVP